MDENETDSLIYSKFGVYEISNSQNLYFPNIEIKIDKISSKAFSYFRVDSDGKTTEKIIPSESEKLRIEACPIRPLNYPARRTDHIFLQLDRDLFLSENSAATIFVQCPIEIGLFVIHDGHKDSLDWVTCDHYNSRFGLYGSPDNGTLCKYVETQIIDSVHDSSSYVNGAMKILIKNELSSGRSINKIIFPITGNSVYYNEDKTIYDGLTVVMKKRGRTDIIDIAPEKIETDWTVSPTLEPTTSNSQMEMGLD